MKKPNLVSVVSDVNSTLAAALSVRLSINENGSMLLRKPFKKSTIKP